MRSVSAEDKAIVRGRRTGDRLNRPPITLRIEGYRDGPKRAWNHLASITFSYP